MSGLSIALIALGSLVGAEPAPVPWALTGTSSIAEIAPPAISHRIERRTFEKANRVLLRAGFSWLSRGDLRNNPGVSAEVGWYPAETIGLDLISATGFFSSLSSTAEVLRRQRGLLPDSQKPLVRLMTGARWAFAYGKLLIEAPDVVVHIDASLHAHVGALITDQSVNPGGDLGLSLQVAAGDHLLVFGGVSWLLSYEARTTSSFASGPMGTLGLGARF